MQQWYSLYTPGSTAASITETTESDSSVNQLDVARVFKGKDKRWASDWQSELSSLRSYEDNSC